MTISRVDARNDEQGRPLWELMRFSDGTAHLRIFGSGGNVAVVMTLKQQRELARVLRGE